MSYIWRIYEQYASLHWKYGSHHVEWGNKDAQLSYETSQ